MAASSREKRSHEALERMRECDRFIPYLAGKSPMCCSIISTKCCRRAAFQITYQVRSDKVRSSIVTLKSRGALKGAYGGA
jgi:hypothetical protein